MLAPPARASDAHAPAAKATAKAEAAKPAAAAPAAEASPPPVDPLERLRERLADRLSTVKGGTGGNAADLRVVSVAPPRSQAVREAATAHAAPPKKATGKAAAGAHGSTHSAHWSYSGEVGPQAWGGLKPEFALCASGQRQSPIDIREGIAVDLEPIQFNYQSGAFAVIDNGHTIQVNLAPGNSIEVGGRRFELLQFHFHRPSEERIDGRQFDLSLHLVHKDAEGRLAVVGVVMGKGAPQPVMQTVWSNLPLEKNQEVKARATLDPSQLLPADKRYYTYMGSLTTPPCSEGVQWLVMRQPVSAAPEQIDIFARLYPMNARPVQSASGRRIMQSN
jgi:carbonic anhydrase